MKICSFATILLLCSWSAVASRPKVAKDLEGLDPNATVDVIVQYKTPPTAAHHLRVAARGGRLTNDLRIAKAGAYSIPAAALDELAKDPDVAYISVDRKVRPMLDLTSAAVNAGLAFGMGFDGTGIGIAVLDSGIQHDVKTLGRNPNDSGKTNVVCALTFVPGSDGKIPTLQIHTDGNGNVTCGGGNDDHYGHGTHVSGILSASGTLPNLGGAPGGSTQTRVFQGIAPKANLIDFQVLDETGTAKDSTVIAAIQEAIALKDTFNIRVMNLSLGRPVFESYKLDPLCQAVEAAWNAGIVVVVAAGNDGRDNTLGTDGYATITAPGNDPFVITVGAMKTEGTPTRADDVIASYSSKGPTLIDHVVKPDIVAPGNKVVSLLSKGDAVLLKEYPSTAVTFGYYTKQNGGNPNNEGHDSNALLMLSGTSMATPVVSGAAALLLQQNPALNPDQVKARLMKTATKNFPAFSTATDPTTGQTYTSFYDIFTVGAGYLDILAALNNTDVANATALSPTAAYNPAMARCISSPTPRPYGATVRCGGIARCGATAPCGAIARFGGTARCGATPSFWAIARCGAIHSLRDLARCGGIARSGGIPRLQNR